MAKRKYYPKPKDHSQHQCRIQYGKGPHKYQLWCVPCNKHVQWLSYKDFNTLSMPPDLID